jgi:hypothetical protein
MQKKISLQTPVFPQPARITLKYPIHSQPRHASSGYIFQTELHMSLEQSDSLRGFLSDDQALHCRDRPALAHQIATHFAALA